MPEVRETKLPGVGVRHDFETSGGERVAVVTHRSGRRELSVYDRDDPDACSSLLTLSPDDTRTLSELLGATRVSETVTAVQQEIEGLAIEWITLSPGSPFASQTVGDGAFRTRTGASIVAILRHGTTIPAPGPEQELEPNDILVAVGTPEGLTQLHELLAS